MDHDRKEKGACDKPSFRLEDIPGLGLIRARSLRKAGYDTLEALCKASVEALGAVPGISPAKAAQIRAHLDGLGGPEPAAFQAAARNDVGVDQPAPEDLVAVDAGPEPITYRSACASAARRVAGLAAWYLQPPQYGRLRRGLARQLARAAQAAGALADKPATIPDDAGPVMRRLGQLAAAVGSVSLDGSAGKKQQQAWADSLRRRRKQLERLVDPSGAKGTDVEEE